MPVDTAWDNPEQTIIRHDFISPWTWDQVYFATDQAWGMLDRSPHTVHIILNFLDQGKVPPGAFEHMRRIGSRRHPRLGAIVIINSNPVIISIGQILNRISPELTGGRQIAANLDSARQLLKH